MHLSTRTLDGLEISSSTGDPRLDGMAVHHVKARTREGLDLCALPRLGVSMALVHDGDLSIGSDGPSVGLGGVSGVGNRATRIVGRDIEMLEIYMPPPMAFSLFRGAATDFAGAVVGLEEVWRRPALRLHDAVAKAENPATRVEAARSFIMNQVDARHCLEPEVEYAWRRITASGGLVRVASLADACGWSRRRLWSRFTDQIGVTPKRAALIARMGGSLEDLIAGRPPADVAAHRGYADQSHMHRDFRDLTGMTPGAIRTHGHELGFVRGSALAPVAA